MYIKCELVVVLCSSNGDFTCSSWYTCFPTLAFEVRLLGT